MHQITYAELADFVIRQMTEAERNRPVKILSHRDGELHPEDETEHPEIGHSSKLMKIEHIYPDGSGPEEFYDGSHKDQYVIIPYVTKEEERQIEILHLEKRLSRNNLDEDWRIKKEKELELLRQGIDLKTIKKFLEEN